MLTQRHWFTRTIYDFVSNGIDVTERGPTVSRSYRVPFADIPARPTRVAVASKRWLLVSVVTALLAIGTGTAAIFDADVEGRAWLFWGILSIVALGAFCASRRSYVIFRTEEPGLAFFDGRPTPSAFQAFVSEMMRRRLDWISAQLLPALGEEIPPDLTRRLRGLEANGVISEEECEQLLLRLQERATSRALRDEPLQ
jgi:hypothetical protein